MIYFLKKERYALDKKEVYIEYEKRLNKKEKALFEYLLNEFKKDTRTFLQLEKDKVLSSLKLKEEKFERLIGALHGKKVNYSVHQEDQIVIEGNFSLVNSFYKQEDTYIVLLGEEVRMSFSEKNFFNRIHLTSVLHFSTPHASNFYLNYLMKLGRELDYTISLKEIKEIMKVEENYGRFYDFERNILKPLLEDINNYTEYYLTYEKVRKEGSNRIDSIRFKGINKYVKYTKKQANELLYLIRDHVDDFEIVYEEIFINIMRKGYEYVYNNLMYTKENYTGNFARAFQKNLIENPTNSEIQEEIDMVSLNKMV